MTEEGHEVEQWVSDPRFELNELRRPVFPVVRKGGIDSAEVDAYLARLERLLRNFVAFTRELEARVTHAKAEARDAADLRQRAVDEAMIAVLETKERILVEAEERAWEIEQDARRRGTVSAGEASTEAQSAISELERRISRYEDQVISLEADVERWRNEATRYKAELNMALEAAPPPPSPETTPLDAPTGTMLDEVRKAVAEMLAESQTQFQRQIAAVAEQLSASGRSDIHEAARSGLGDVIAQAHRAADQARQDADAVMAAARQTHDAVETQAAELLASAERARQEAAEMRNAAEETRRRATDEASQMVTEASAILDELRSARAAATTSSTPADLASPAPAEVSPNPPDLSGDSGTGNESFSEGEPGEPADADNPQTHLSRYTRRSAQLPRMDKEPEPNDATFSSLRPRPGRRPSPDDSQDR